MMQRESKVEQQRSRKSQEHRIDKSEEEEKKDSSHEYTVDRRQQGKCIKQKWKVPFHCQPKNRD